jgi:SAM-dependent methyltransferase
MMPPRAFDAMAADYDTAFTHTFIGRRMRSAIWRRCDALFQPGSRLLELNCGTGEDALHFARRGVRVVATDASAAMLSVARDKIRAAGLEAAVRLEQVRIEDLDTSMGTFDHVLSNFGGLNCVRDLPSAAATLASIMPPGGRAVLCVMGRLVPWEWTWFALHGDPRRAARRLRPGGTMWRDVHVHYPGIAHLRRAFAPMFRATRVAALGVLLPPPYAEPWARSHPRLVDTLDRIERATETAWPLPWLADHYLIELERVAA